MSRVLLLQPLQLKHLSLRNRILSTAHAPGYIEEQLQRNHDDEFYCCIG